MLAYGGPPFLLAYAASKAAIVALTKGTANTVKRDGMRVFGINLGWTWTPAEQEVQTRLHGLPENWSETLGAKQPFGRLLMPKDPAALISFLVSEDARMMRGRSSTLISTSQAPWTTTRGLKACPTNVARGFVERQAASKEPRGWPTLLSAWDRL